MSQLHSNCGIATGATKTPELTVGGQRSPQKSSSTKNAAKVNMEKQVFYANSGVGTDTVGVSGTQAHPEDRKVASETGRNCDGESAIDVTGQVTSRLRL